MTKTFSEPNISTVEEINKDANNIPAQQVSAREILRWLQISFLNVEEAAELLRVKPKTIYTWISQDRIPVRYAGGRPLFLLSELLNWTLPEKDEHAGHRLYVPTSSKIAKNRLVTNQERRVSDAG